MSSSAVSSGLHSASLYFHTLRHLRPSQWLARASLKAKGYVLPKARYVQQTVRSVPARDGPRNSVREAFSRSHYDPPDHFRFLGCEIDTGGRWFPRGVSTLWLYNLHYFEYLFEVAEAEDYQRLLCSWIDRVPPKTCHAWHPYTTSLRLCNWIWTMPRFAGDIDDSARRIILLSLSNQLSFINDHLEFDVLGNHLLENLKALIVGATFFRDRHVVERAVGLLQAQLAEQILEDGGHYERSPMYHAIVLETLLAIDDALSRWGEIDRSWLHARIGAAASFLQAVSIDGELPLLNDSAHGIAAPVPVLLANVARRGLHSAEPRQANFLQSSGLFVLKAPELALVFDGGELGPPYLLAHAHCDTTSLQLWIRGSLVLADSGVYEYQTGPWRQYFRAGAAHNVVTVADTDPSEVWSSFRVGRRQHPIGFCHDARRSLVECSHDGYSRLGVLAKRTVHWNSVPPGVAVTDVLDNAGEPRPFAIHCHFGPDWTPDHPLMDPVVSLLHLRHGGEAVTLFWQSDRLSVACESSWYSPEFGVKTLRPYVRLDGVTSLGRTSVTWGVVDGHLSKTEAQLFMSDRP